MSAKPEGVFAHARVKSLCPSDLFRLCHLFRTSTVLVAEEWTEEEAAEAARVAAIARRAEARAAQRAAAQNGSADVQNGGRTHGKRLVLDSKDAKIRFRSKKEREADALRRLQERRQADGAARPREPVSHRERARPDDRSRSRDRRSSGRERSPPRERKPDRKAREPKVDLPVYTGTKEYSMYFDGMDPKEQEKELQAIKQQHLGMPKRRRHVAKPSEKFAKARKFEWDPSEDTSADTNPLYSDRFQASLLFGRGFRAGIDVREQRKQSKFLETLAEKRQRELESILEAEKQAEQRQEKETQRGEEDEEGAAGAREQLGRLRQRQEKAAERAERDDGLGPETMHWSEKALEDMSERDWRIFKEDFDIHVRGGHKGPLVPHPLRFWNEAPLDPSLMQSIQEIGYNEPTPIQRQALPMGLQGRDLIGVAETGSGKTAAFVLPMLHIILQKPAEELRRCAEDGPLAVILAPVRELAQQIEVETQKLAKHAGIRSVSIVGGQEVEMQATKLRRGVEIVIATPGRLIDMIHNGYVVLNQCRYVVLDEADRMIDMGFEPQVTEILDHMGHAPKGDGGPASGGGAEEMKDDDQQGGSLFSNSRELSTGQLADSSDPTAHGGRVTVMFSATMPPEVEKLAQKYMDRPVTVKIGDWDSGKNKRIRQIVMQVPENLKRRKLREALSICPKPVIVFVNIKKNADVVGRTLQDDGFAPVVLHGDKDQAQREAALADFKSGKFEILVATDVAGRGIDVPDVAQIINYDLPSSIDRYSHRIGRTGRAGREGQALSFFNDADEKVLYDLKQYLISTEQAVPRELEHHPAAQAPAGGDSGPRKGKVQYSV